MRDPRHLPGLVASARRQAAAHLTEACSALDRVRSEMHHAPSPDMQRIGELLLIHDENVAKARQAISDAERAPEAAATRYRSTNKRTHKNGAA